MTASEERQKANLVHQSLGNKTFQEQTQSRYKMKNNNEKWFESRLSIASDHFWSQKSGHHRQELWVFPKENEWFRIFTRSRSTMCLWGPFHRLRESLLPVHTNSSGFNAIFWRQRAVQGGDLGSIKVSGSKVTSAWPPFYWGKWVFRLCLQLIGDRIWPNVR